jgi:hypothetical protein
MDLESTVLEVEVEAPANWYAQEMIVPSEDHLPVQIQGISTRSSYSKITVSGTVRPFISKEK